MIQEIITYLIVIGAVAYTAFNVVRFLIPRKAVAGKSAACGSCSASCGGCTLK